MGTSRSLSPFVRRTTCVVYYGYGAGARDTTYYGRVKGSADTSDFRECVSKGLSHFFAAEIAGSEVELAYKIAPEGFALQVVITVSLVLREYDPGMLGDKGQPKLVQDSTLKIISVTAILDAVGHQRIRESAGSCLDFHPKTR